uniref:Uncharacterized protein n=2 Tax=Kalanchoe fedtschenkoi TaxID=63787 RepID=A0A7N0UZE8_KALFE
MPQSQPWQQSGCTEMQLLKQQVMLKQLQEMQRQQQFQSFADMRQHSAISSKNVEGVQFGPVINGTPVHNTSNMFPNWGQHTASPTLQGISQLASAHEHCSSSDGEAVQRYGGSSYDSTLGKAGSNLNPIYLQGIPSEHKPIFNMIGDNSIQQQQSVANSTGFIHSFSGGQNMNSSNRAFASRQDNSGNNVYGLGLQNFGKDNIFRSFEQANVMAKNGMAYEINENEQGGWVSNPQEDKLMHISPSQGSVTLDPLEEKILFNMDDNLWDISSGKSTEIGCGNTRNTLGSWSALMQSALAETSSSDTGMQEEWSGLTFQNTDPSVDNQTSNFVESGLQQAECAENSQQPVSVLSATEYQYLNSSDMHFPGFHQAVTNNQSEQDRLLHTAHEYTLPFSKTEGRLESDLQSSLAVGALQAQVMNQTKHGWAGPSYRHAESSPSQMPLSSIDQQMNNTDFWSAQKVQSGTSSPLVGNNARMNNFFGGPDSQKFLASPETQNQEANQLAYPYHTNAADVLRDNVRMVNQHVSSNTPQTLDGSYVQSNSNALELSSKGRSGTNMSSALDNSIVFQASNLGSQRSQTMLQLLQNINQSRAEGSLIHSSSISQGQRTLTTAASEAQYHKQSTSQGSFLPPSPSYQRFPNHNFMDTSQNSWQKNAAPATLPSVPNPSQLQWQQISRTGVGSHSIQSALYSAATRYLNVVASPHLNTAGSTHANPFAQQYIGFGTQSVSQPSVASGLSQQDGFPMKQVNQWQAVPIQKHPAAAETEIVRGSESPNRQFEGTIGFPENINEQETQIIASCGSSAKAVMKYGEEKSRPPVLSEVLDSNCQPTSGMQDSMEKLGSSSEKNTSVNQMNILYGMTDQCLDITRPNKRKSPTSELLPWHNEVVKISLSSPDIRMDELEWAQATNRLMEVGNDAELLKAGQSLFRPRKRLLLTTRLMQKLLSPAPQVILFRDAASAYESVTYIVARLSLGDACNLSSARAKTDPADKSDMEEKMNVSRVVNNLSCRFKQLEDNLLRYDKMPSLVDIRVESQDLERFSVINRFAKFHSRTTPNPSDPFSSGPPKMYRQRYVTACPMPKDIPDSGLQCVAL